MLNNKGQSLVLFVLLIPIFVMIMASVIDVGNLISAKTEIDNMLLNYYRNDGFGISSFGLSYFGGRG